MCEKQERVIRERERGRYASIPPSPLSGVVANTDPRQQWYTGTHTYVLVIVFLTVFIKTASISFSFVNLHLLKLRNVRSAADTTLQANITSEVSSRVSTDGVLQANINTEASLRASKLKID